MKFVIVIIISILIGFNNKQPKKEMITKLKASTVINSIKSDTCFFDQSTQTDDFLKGIKELSGYSWDHQSKTAEIVLNDHWGLEIKRGGCDFFTLSANFIYDRELIFEDNQSFIFERIIWITNLIEGFEGDKIKYALENNKFFITKKSSNFYYINLMDESIYESYIINFTSSDKGTNFGIEYFLN